MRLDHLLSREPYRHRRDLGIPVAGRDQDLPALEAKCRSGLVTEHISQYPVFRAQALSCASSEGAFRTLIAV